MLYEWQADLLRRCQWLVLLWLWALPELIVGALPQVPSKVRHPAPLASDELVGDCAATCSARTERLVMRSPWSPFRPPSRYAEGCFSPSRLHPSPSPTCLRSCAGYRRGRPSRNWPFPTASRCRSSRRGSAGCTSTEVPAPTAESVPVGRVNLDENKTDDPSRLGPSAGRRDGLGSVEGALQAHHRARRPRLRGKRRPHQRGAPGRPTRDGISGAWVSDVRSSTKTPRVVSASAPTTYAQPS